MILRKIRFYRAFTVKIFLLSLLGYRGTPGSAKVGNFIYLLM